MQPHVQAHGVQAVDEPLLGRPHELLIKLRPDKGRRGIAHAHEIGPGIFLGLRKGEFHLDDEVEEVAHEPGLFEKIHHDVVDAAQVGGFGNGAFHPALHDAFAAHTLFEPRNPLHTVVHAPAAQRVRNGQPDQVFRALQQGVAFVDITGAKPGEPIEG